MPLQDFEKKSSKNPTSTPIFYCIFERLSKHANQGQKGTFFFFGPRGHHWPTRPFHLGMPNTTPRVGNEQFLMQKSTENHGVNPLLGGLCLLEAMG
jgi:hypothetical protein